MHELSLLKRRTLWWQGGIRFHIKGQNNCLSKLINTMSSLIEWSILNYWFLLPNIPKHMLVHLWKCHIGVAFLPTLQRYLFLLSKEFRKSPKICLQFYWTNYAYWNVYTTSKSRDKKLLEHVSFIKYWKFWVNKSYSAEVIELTHSVEITGILSHTFLAKISWR